MQAKRYTRQRGGRGGAFAPWARFVAAVALVLASRVLAAAHTYPIDQDPMRLGTIALGEGRLGDAKARFEEAIAAEYQVPKATLGLAEIAFRSRHMMEAESLYRRALQLSTAEGYLSFPEAHAGLGLLLLRQGRDIEAAEEFATAYEEKPGLWDASYGQALILFEQGLWEQGKDLLEKGSKRKGLAEGEDRYHHGMALWHLHEGKIEKAEKEALLALTQNPGDAEYAMLVAEIYEKRNAPTLAIEAYERALAAPEMVPTAPTLHTLGRLYQKVERYNDARDTYAASVRADSTYAPALKDLAMLYALANEPEMAARTYLRYVLIERKDVEALLGLTNACLEVDRVGQALEAARAALAVDSTSVETRAAFVRAGLRSNDPSVKAEAATVFALLPDSLSWSARDLVTLAGADIEAKRFDAARARIGEALRLDPSLAEAHFRAGVLHLNTGQPDSAARHLEKAAALDTASAPVLVNLAVAYFQTKETRRAIAPLRSALAIDEATPNARLYLAQALAVADSIDAAATEYEKLVRAEPSNAKALRGLAFCHVRRSRFQDAVKAYKAATAAEPGNADGWAGLGNAYLGVENAAAAEGAFQKAKAIDPNNPTLKRGLDLLARMRSAAGAKPAQDGKP